MLDISDSIFPSLPPFALLPSTATEVYGVCVMESMFGGLSCCQLSASSYAREPFAHFPHTHLAGSTTDLLCGTYLHQAIGGPSATAGPPPAQAARASAPHGASAEGGWVRLSPSGIMQWPPSRRPLKPRRTEAPHGASAEGG